jgi:hypothetical protein
MIDEEADDMRPVIWGDISTEHAFEVAPRVGVVSQVVQRNPGQSVANQPSGSIAFRLGKDAERFRQCKRRAKIPGIHAIDKQSPHRP